MSTYRITFKIDEVSRVSYEVSETMYELLEELIREKMSVEVHR